MTHIRQSGRRERDQTEGVQQDELQQCCLLRCSLSVGSPPSPTWVNVTLSIFKSCQLPTWWLSGRTRHESLIPPLSAAECGGVKCEESALSPLTQGQQIKCDVHSAATHIQTGFSLHTHVCGLVTGQTLPSPLVLAWQASFSVNAHRITAKSFPEQAEFKSVAVIFPCERLPSLIPAV